MKAKRPRGRPPIYKEAGARYQIHLPPQVAEWLREYGAGSLSRGISSLVFGLINRKKRHD